MQLTFDIQTPVTNTPNPVPKPISKHQPAVSKTPARKPQRRKQEKRTGELARLVIKFREDTDLTVTQLAKKIGVGVHTITGIEKGKLPSVNIVLKVAFGLRLSVLDIWDDLARATNSDK